MEKEKVGIIVQRYGLQVNGGAETLARMVAGKLAEKYDVTVLTSRALDYHKWEPVLKEGEEFENGIRILRFDHPTKRTLSAKKQHKQNRKERGRLIFQKLYRFLGKPKWYLSIFPEAQHQGVDEKKWIELQGPATYEMMPYLKNHANEYAAYIFFTYLYYPTAYGLTEVGSKSIFIPTMHDEKAAYETAFRNVMRAPGYIFFLTESEKKFSQKQFDIDHIPNKVISVGIDVPGINADRSAIKKLGVKGKYILYVGRIEAHKGCGELLKYFASYKKEYQGELQLVLAGKNDMQQFSHPDVLYAGFVSEEEKWQLMKQAEAMVIPSKYESLSLVLLESFAYKVPVLVNAECDVLKDHVDISKGGLLFYDEQSFQTALHEIAEGSSIKAMGEAGYLYVKENYNWKKVMDAFDEAIDFTKQANAGA